MSTISQRSSLHYTGSWQLLHYLLASMYGSVEVVVSDGAESQALRVFNVVTVTQEPPVVVIEVCGVDVVIVVVVLGWSSY